MTNDPLRDDEPAPNPVTTPYDPPAPAVSHPTLFFGPDGLRPGWSLLLFFLLVAILLVPTLPIFRHLIAHGPTHAQLATHQPVEHPVSATLIQDGLLFGVLLLASFLMSRIERRPFAAYGIGRTPRALRQFLTGIGWGLVFLSLLVFLLKASHLLVFESQLLTAPDALRFGAEWALGFLSVGLFEEYFLRGFLLFTLARALSGLFALLDTRHRHALGFWTAATLLAFLFGLGHRANPGESSIGLLTAGLAALVFSLSLWRTGSLWWAIGFHTAWDWAQSFLYGVADSGIMMSHHLFSTHPNGTPLLSGGLTGPEGSIYVLPILTLTAAVIYLTLPKPGTTPESQETATPSL